MTELLKENGMFLLFYFNFFNTVCERQKCWSAPYIAAVKHAVIICIISVVDGVLGEKKGLMGKNLGFASTGFCSSD